MLWKKYIWKFHIVLHRQYINWLDLNGKLVLWVAELLFGNKKKLWIFFWKRKYLEKSTNLYWATLLSPFLNIKKCWDLMLSVWQKSTFWNLQIDGCFLALSLEQCQSLDDMSRYSILDVGSLYQLTFFVDLEDKNLQRLYNQGCYWLCVHQQ